MKFDAVVGNPPYHEEAVGKGTNNAPIYNSFYDLAERVSTKYCLISPARFLSRAGDTPKPWEEKMLNDEHIKIVFFEQNSAKVFPSTDIKGGVVVIYRNAEKTFDAIGVFAIFEELNAIALKVSRRTEITIDTIILNRGQYRFSDLVYQKFPKKMLRASDRRIAPSAFERFPEFFTDKKPSTKDVYVRIIGRLNNKRVYKWCRRDYMTVPKSFEKFKVVIPKANGSGAIGEVLSTPMIGKPMVGFTETFISIGAFDNEADAQNCLKYVRTKFARTMLGILKVTQNSSREKWSKVPLQDFTSKSDIDWTKPIPDIDKQLYDKYKLTKEEIAFIESKISAMD